MKKATIVVVVVVVDDFYEIYQTTNIGNKMDHYITNRSKFEDYFELKFIHKGIDITHNVSIHSIVPRRSNIDDSKYLIHFDNVTVMYRVLNLNK